MKISVLTDNTSLREDLTAEFGLSVLVEDDGFTLLFDTGLSGAIVDNAGKMSIDLSSCNAVALSHNHRDHCGGLLHLPGILRPDCPIYARPGFFTDKWWDHHYDDPALPTYEQAVELVGPSMQSSWFFQNGLSGFRLLTDDVVQLTEHIFLVGNFPRPDEEEAVHVSQRMTSPDGSLIGDTFPEEQVCVLKTGKGLVLLTGCAHSGIMNIIQTVKQRFPGETLHAIIGGTHLVPPNPDRIAATFRYLKDLHLSCAGVCHCTGDSAMQVFSSSLDSYRKVGAGFTAEF